MKNSKSAYLFIIPGFIGVGIFLIIPYIDVFFRGFTSASTGEFVGLDNFKEVLENEAFRAAMGNTIRFMVVCIPLILLISLAISIFIYENPRRGNWLKTGFLIPMAISVTSVVLVWRFLFDQNGIINAALDSMGLDMVNWMNSDNAFGILVLSYIWKNLGYNIVLWLATLSTVDASIQEAAKLDGASNFQRAVHVTLPAIKSGAFVIIVLTLLNSYKVFREAYLVAGEYPHDSIYLIQHLFNNWFRDLDIAKMAAGAVINSVILIALILILQKCWKMRGEES